MEYLLVVAVAALAGYLAYRVSVSLGRRVAGDEVLQVPPPTRRTTGAAGPVGDPGTPHPIGADPGTPDPVAGAPGTPHPVAAPTGG
ncbi:MAG TPA: hypothetical protein VNO79_15720, partial [Actinomycetota bacterium]|nr:hypothetical protein [Actinomycetota bacterium]